MHPTYEHPNPEGKSWRTLRKRQIAIQSLQGILTPHCQQWIDFPNKKSNKNIAELNDTLDQMDFIDIYRTFHPKKQNTHFSQTHMDHSQR